MPNEIILDMHYKDAQTGDMLRKALLNIVTPFSGAPLFICIGSDKHILDCFGPLIGSMVKDIKPQTLLYGHLDQPLHAKNITQEITIIRSMHPGKIQIAIDASVGDSGDYGNIKMRKGPIVPGKALAKKLPPIGDYAITGVLGNQLEPYHITAGGQDSLGPVYHMAKIIAEAICAFQQDKAEQ